VWVYPPPGRDRVTPETPPNATPAQRAEAEALIDFSERARVRRDRSANTLRE